MADKTETKSPTPTVSEPKQLTAADLETVDAIRKVEPVAVPEWGGVVYVRELTALEKGKLDETIYDDDGKLKGELFGPGMAAACLCDAAGKPFYVPGDLRAILTVASKSVPAVKRVTEAAVRLNKARPEDAAAGKGDSAAGPAAGSPTASPSPSAA